MEEIDVANAFYIKLGKGGMWEDDAIARGLVRIGWSYIPLVEINKCNWRKIERMIQRKIDDKGVATRDLNMLKNFQQSPPGRVWITFTSSKLWWCRIGDTTILEDADSKYRPTLDGWHDKDIQGNLLREGSIPGKIQKYRSYRRTLCHVRETDVLARLINNLHSDAHKAVSKAKAVLVDKVREALNELRWQEFELLADLIFSDNGWRRISKIGESMVFSDIEYEEPVTGYQYQVQVKSVASLAEFKEYASRFSTDAYEKLFFVVHSSKQDLETYQLSDENIELVHGQRLAEMVVNAGLIDWLLERIR